MSVKEVHDFLMSLPDVKLDFPFGDDVAVYKVLVPNKKMETSVTDSDWKMFALVPEDRHPLSISLKCDPSLAKVLREKYESIMEGYHLSKKHWNTMLLTGQLDRQEVQDLILHSYSLVTKTESALPVFSKS